MGLRSRVREWIGNLLGSTGEETEPRENEEPRLDPENVRRVRKRAEDDPAARLDEVRRTEQGDDHEE